MAGHYRYFITSVTAALLTLSFNGITVAGLSASSRLQTFNGESEQTRSVRGVALSCIELMRQILQNNPHLSISTVTSGAEWQLQWNDVSSSICTTQPSITCDSNSKFRTASGICNNLQNPTWGQSFRPQARFLLPVYDDQISSPRTKAKNGGDLPSPRLISNIVLQNTKEQRFHRKHTMMVMSFGQFLDHDVILTPTIRANDDGGVLSCCVANPPDGCFPISIPEGDPFFKTTCMNFIRSSPVFNDPCRPGTREQTNELTSFIDASNVYGSSDNELQSLRTHQHGLLKMQNQLLPPSTHSGECVLRHASDFCMQAGDRRVNEVGHLTINHIVFAREHNRIAKKLAKLNSHWNDERLFQETRKIIGAMIQKIVYYDWLPIILHKGYIRKFCLHKSTSERCRNQGYDPTINPTIRNAIGAAVLRFGHSLVPPKQGVTSPYYFRTVTHRLQDTFLDPHLPIQDTNGMARFALTSPSMLLDRFIISALRDELFTDNVTSFDLGALNIQRGRDHGLPPYTAFRRFCGFSPVKHFKRSRGGLIDHDVEAAAKLEEAYNHPDDIDLFPGALSEIPLPGSTLGPTFSCLLAKQFRALRYGDRFFFEHTNLINSFSSDQIRSIRKVSLAKVYCENFDICSIQCNVFKLCQRSTDRVFCRQLRDINLVPWKERS